MNSFFPTASIQTFHSVNDTEAALADLQERQLVIVNLQYLPSEQAQRVIDTISGAVCAIGGCVMPLGDSVYLFAPDFFQVSTLNPALA